MPDFDINIVIKDGQAIGKITQVRNELDRTEKKATGLRSTLRGLFAGFGAAVVIREFINLSNATVAIDNRLKIVSDSTEEVNASFERLAEISRKTRSPLEENVALFQRAKQAQKELGATNDELFQFVQATGTALAIQGGAANTARGALIQLSQSIGATIVRAEEFNSILEGALPLAQAAARGIDEAGGSVAKLRQLVITGKISSAEFFRAIVSQQQFLEEQFARTTPTIAQAFTVLRNNAIETFRTFDGGIGITTTLANAILFLADNLETVARVLAAGAIFFTITRGATLALAAVQLLTAGIVAASAAFIANPIGAALTVITLAIAGLISLVTSFGDQLVISGTNGATALDLISVAFGRLRELGASFINFISTTFNINFKAAFENMGDTVVSFIRFFASGIDKIIALWKGVMAALTAIWEGGWKGILEIVLRGFQFLARQWEKLLNIFVAGLNLFRDEPIAYFTKLGDTFGDLADTYGVDAGKAFNEAFAAGVANGPAAAAVDSMISDAATIALRRIRALVASDAVINGPDTNTPPSTNTSPLSGGGGSQTSFSDVVKEYEKGIEALQKLGQEQRIYNEILRVSDRIGRDLTSTEKEQITALVKKTEVLQAASDIYDDLNGRLDEYIIAQQAVNSLLERNAISQAQANLVLSQTQLASDLRDADSSLGGQFDFEARLQEIRNYTEERRLIFQQAREAELIDEQEYRARLIALTQASQREILNAELDRWSLAISSAQGSIGVLLDAAETYAGKQSGIYKGLFIAQKAFAIAEATINTFRAISNALAAPFPPPIPQTLAAAAAVAGGAQVAAIVASTIQGLATGGRVSGPGGPRDDKAGLFALSNGEFVVNAAAAQANLPLLEAINRGMKPLQGMQNGGLVSPIGLSNAGSTELSNTSRGAPKALPELKNNVQVPVNIIAVSSREEALATLNSAEGQEAIMFSIGKKAPAVRNLLGIEN